MFCEDLRRQTADAHREAESAPFIQDLLAGRLGVRAYVDLLAALLPVYRALETALARAAEDATVAVFDHRALDRADRIAADLRGFGRDPGQPVPPAALRYAACVERSAASPPRLLAHHYTRYLGDIAGGQVIAAMVARHYGVGREHLTYLDFSTLGDTTHYRRQYRTLLDLLPWGPVEQAEFVAECQVAYRSSAALFADLGRACGLAAPEGPTPSGFLASELRHVRLREAPR